MKPIAIALSFAIMSTTLPARAAPPRATEQEFRELEQASGQDLSREWAAYNGGAHEGSFSKYAERRFRVRRDAGRGLAIVGASLVFASSFLLLFAFTGEGRVIRVNGGIGLASLGIGGGLMISGGAVAHVYAKRLDRLDDGNEKLEYGGGRAQAMPLANGGLGLRLAF